MRVTYSLTISPDGHLIIKVRGTAPDIVYIAGKTRVQVTRDVLFFLHVKDVPVNRDRLQNELDKMIWNGVPKREWY